ncbi:MAG: hypothetical protein J6T77_02795, partial [Clostridia bacterium]|nr:hypothetical protein [Clostridia bacterium]
ERRLAVIDVRYYGYVSQIVSYHKKSPHKIWILPYFAPFFNTFLHSFALFLHKNNPHSVALRRYFA